MPGTGKRTRSGALAQYCAHASHMVGTPAQVHLLSTARLPRAKHTCASAPVLSSAHMSGTCSARRTRLPHDKRTRSNPPRSQQCALSIPAQVRPLNSAHTFAKWFAHPLQCACSVLHACLAHGKLIRSSAPVVSSYVWRMASTLVQAHSKHTCSSAPALSVAACHAPLRIPQ